MKAIAWDDDIKEPYFDQLVDSLKRIPSFSVEFHRDFPTFERRLVEAIRRNEIDFVVTDLVDESDPVKGTSDRKGLAIARQAAQPLSGRPVPVFVVTWYPKLFDTTQFGRNVILKSKKLSPSWMAEEIRRELVDRGFYVDRSKAFIISSRNPIGQTATDQLSNHLSASGITPVVLTPGTTLNNIQVELIDQMKDCGAVIAICTPDDKLDNGTAHPRLNVVIELGIAMGLAQGLHRTIILRHKDAVIPSDFGGALWIEFASDVSETFPELEKRLRLLKMVP